jgi:8-oxo-dGTP pyrophosphatase MutT (NUDIX family)
MTREHATLRGVSEPAAPVRGDEQSLLERLRAAVTMPAGAPPEPPGGRRRASVLLLFNPAEPGLPLLFVLRSDQLRFHPGQIAFPGGGEEPGDGDVIDTALREAAEEVALPPDNVEVLGVLSPLITATSERWLTPVVGLQRAEWQVIADPHEIAEWFCIPLTTLLRAPHTVRTLERDGVRRAVHFYEQDGRIIWGVSAAILHELMARLGRSD